MSTSLKHTVYLPFVHGTPPTQWRFDGTLSQVVGDTLDLSTLPLNEGAEVELGIVTSAMIRLNDKFTLSVAIFEDAE